MPDKFNILAALLRSNRMVYFRRLWWHLGFEKDIKKHEKLLKSFEKTIESPIYNPHIFIQALKHRSYLSIMNEERVRSYERLEFLGDLILNLITGEFLYNLYPHQDEGDLTKSKSLLVNKKVLAQQAEALGLGQFILMSEGEEKSGGRLRASILSDVLESVIGAVYIDSGYEASRKFILRHVLHNVDRILSDDLHFNYKGELLEWSQAQDRGIPAYTVVNQEGPEHNKEFTVEVLIKQIVYGSGKGLTKKDAEQQAARQALKKIKRN
ncbi:ribonuclease III [bacterium]|nr:MAG: ribonuclease III [bacterium]